ncbi:MAG: hypothetical protein J0H55_12070 [Chitinophagaceae bacterium]|nr:hypothetical protein [Chitinophagaceae bacterium]
MESTQIIQQLKNWQTLLTALRHENSLLKIKLSELVDNSVMSDFLDKAETLNNELISNDQTITLLLSLSDQLQSQIPNCPTHDKVLELRQKELESDIRKFAERFRSLSTYFQKDLNVN